jgi:ABC-type dipeptide/oligopeptide/nickel transport system permease component
MTGVLAGRLLRAFAVLLAVSALTFVVGQRSGDPVQLMLRSDATLAQKAELRHRLGLDRTLFAQYSSYLVQVLQGDFGMSYRQHISVGPLIAARLPYSLGLAGAAFLIALAAGTLLGIAAALHAGRWFDHLVAVLATLGQVVPGFWVGLVLVLLFAVHWQILPVSGTGNAAHFVLPVLTLAIPTAGRIARLIRSGLLEVLRSDFIRVSRAKGLYPRQVLIRHAIPNALLPLMTQAGLELGDMVGSAFIIETVFAWPGLGRLAVNAVLQRDFLVVQGCVLVMAACFILINLAVDLMYARIDPRIRDA